MDGLINLAVLEWLEHEIQRVELNQQRRLLRNTVDPLLIPEEEFIRHYRLSKNMFNDLCDLLRPHFMEAASITKISVELKVLTMLYFLAHGSYQKCVRGNVVLSLEQSTVSKILAEATDAMSNIMPQFISFPQTVEQKNSIKNGFYEKFHFPGIIGAIDCTHIGIVAPKSTDPLRPAAAYFNRKGYHSLNVEMICDSDLKITYCNARYPGATHDAAIWSLSPIRNMLQNGYLNGDNNTWLIGDSGYPLEPWLLIPIDYDDVNTPEGTYTTCHILARNSIERCFGVLKQRFRCLLKHRILHYDHDRAAKIIYACVTLHNMCIINNLPEPENNEEILLLNDPIDVEVEVENLPGNINPLRREGLQIIERLKITHFFNIYLILLLF